MTVKGIIKQKSATINVGTLIAGVCIVMKLG